MGASGPVNCLRVRERSLPRSICVVCNCCVLVCLPVLTFTPTSPDASPIRITYTGSTSLFNGVPDWVYEEEVYSSPYTLWFSPSAQKIAFLTLDETLVDTYTFPIYNPTSEANAVVPYTSSVTMKYPKPGFANPFVRVQVFDAGRYSDLVSVVGSTEREAAAGATVELDWPARLPSANSIVSEVAWVGNTTLIVKEVDRAAEEGSVIVFELYDSESAEAFGSSVRRLGQDGERRDGGWIESVSIDGISLRYSSDLADFSSNRFLLSYCTRPKLSSLFRLHSRRLASLLTSISCPQRRATTTSRSSAPLARTLHAS